ncbi:ABC transporter substrate-binding protein [Hamadaea sp.]|uniref:ABC transporter substrate-binding protein n=1 Tax=Hamadaea sp. TaxID=2024425 RepID=UPI0025B9D76D|nr:ABC transporter substrate-binding protein [Hamadaea sp.]
MSQSDPAESSRELSRRGFLGLAAAGLSATALSACTGPSTSTDNGGGDAAKLDFTGVKPAGEITFWSSNPGASQEVTQQIIDAFHASQSDIKVQLVTAGSNYEDIAQKFQAAQAGGKLPDLVVLSDVWWFRYYLQDSIIPLDTLFTALDWDTSDYRDQLLTDYKYGGSIWAVPWARSTPLFYWNKAHWQAAGLPDRAPKTWDEFAEWAPKLKSANAGTQNAFQLPALAGYAGWSFQNVLWGRGGSWSAKDSFDITCDKPEAVAALQFLADAVYKNKWSGVAGKDSTNDLSAGAVSATVGSTGSLVGILKVAKFDVGAGFLPGGPAATSPVCPTGGAGVGIPKKIKPENQLAAATFIKFLTTPENTLKFAQATGYMPVRKSADPSSLIAKAPQAKVAIDQLAVTRNQDWARVFLPGADQEMANACAAILTKNGDVQSELSNLKAKLEGIYSSQVKPHLR